MATGKATEYSTMDSIGGLDITWQSQTYASYAIKHLLMTSQMLQVFIPVTFPIGIIYVAAVT